MVLHRTRAKQLAFLLTLGIGVGCSKSESTGSGGAAVDPMTSQGGASPQDVLAKLPGGDEFAAGKKVYADNKCANCHKLGDTGGGGGTMAGPPLPPGAGGAAPPGPGPMPSGPDLTKVGGKADCTKQWLAEHIRDAKKHKPGSRMPEYGPDKITDADLDKLAGYLASRK